MFNKMRILCPPRFRNGMPNPKLLCSSSVFWGEGWEVERGKQLLLEACSCVCWGHHDNPGLVSLWLSYCTYELHVRVAIWGEKWAKEHKLQVRKWSTFFALLSMVFLSSADESDFLPDSQTKTLSFMTFLTVHEQLLLAVLKICLEVITNSPTVTQGQAALISCLGYNLISFDGLLAPLQSILKTIARGFPVKR